MATISCHSNQSTYPIGTKTQLFVSAAYRFYMWNLVRIGFIALDRPDMTEKLLTGTLSLNTNKQIIALEEMSFENVDGRRMPSYTSNRRDF